MLLKLFNVEGTFIAGPVVDFRLEHFAFHQYSYSYYDCS